MPAAIEIRNLTKQYPVPLKREAVNAVDNLSLTVGEGEIFGFLGANGAGKTTTIKILLGLIYPTQGEASVLGKPAGDIEVKHRVAYLPESPYFYEHMTASEVVTFYAQLFGMKREEAKRKADELVDFVGLGGKSDRNKRISEFSKGMRQRVGIAQSLINDPQLLFYDEPTSGLDAIARRDIRDLMLELKRQGKAMFLSSHQLEDVEAVCHRVSIIHKGKLRAIGSVDELLQGERVEIRIGNVSPDLAAKLKTTAPSAIVVEGRTTFTEANEPDAVFAIMEMVRGSGGRIDAIVPKRRTLEDLFVEIVGERIVIGDGGTAFTASESFPTVASTSRGDGLSSSAVSSDVPHSEAFNTTEATIVEAEPGEDAAAANGAATATKTRRPGANKYKELNGK
ncbi:MAG: ABC transporter ATP-binding protein [Cytophagales bacterium]|nr:ABC transporter ATP-binding protein [Armatimonadota bacterium]